MLAMSNLQIHKIPFVEEWLREQSAEFLEIINDIGLIVFLLIVIIIMILLITMLEYLLENCKLALKLLRIIKKKLIWSSVLRAMLQGYFILTFSNLSLLAQHIRNTSE